ncbi:hypothetical protein BJX66DRAFT_319333 [Aspergillus keveii]|uniref:Xylanolytic transcriptional activator regulatory domain-containing protein n=1 Tax=Aspergillus keveii TaxID=714993 RepID=A0ABR4FIE3_9EURO
MQPPELSTVQASYIACCSLLCCRHNGTRKFASVHFARCISMADRLGLFAGREMAEDVNLRSDTFDWMGWVEEETFNRVACAIFSLDMAFCVHLARPPSFSGSSFLVRMPCYERCWEATDFSTCLRYLQNAPPPTNVLSGMCKLQRWHVGEQMIFYPSRYGMFTLMLGQTVGSCSIYPKRKTHVYLLLSSGLHSSLLRVIQEDTEPRISPFSYETLSQLIDRPLASLKPHVKRESVALIADMLVELHGSPAMKHCNQTINTWRHDWHQVCLRNPIHESRGACRSFFTDPMPFWYLANGTLPNCTRHSTSAIISTATRSDSTFPWRPGDMIGGISISMIGSLHG